MESYTHRQSCPTRGWYVVHVFLTQHPTTPYIATTRKNTVIADNELVSVDSVAFLPALVFLDCSRNRLSVLSKFTSALAGPPRLAEVVAEGNKAGWFCRRA